MATVVQGGCWSGVQGGGGGVHGGGNPLVRTLGEHLAVSSTAPGPRLSAMAVQYSI